MRTNRWWLLAGLGLVLPALAADFSSYGALFPAHPCQDGWLGCVQGGMAVGAGTVKDGGGHPMAADARIGWWDLQPTAAFSPFGTLSAYSGPAGGAVAAAAPPAPVERPAPREVRERENDTPERPVAAPERPVAVASAPTPPPAAVGGSVRPPGLPAPAAPVAPVAAPATSSVRPAAVPAPVASAPPATVGSVRPTTTAPTAETARVATTSAVSDDCSDLVKLEPAAMMGQLTSGQGKCLEGRIATESQQTMRDRVSRLLINNADAKGDKAEWERLVKRHLEDIDRSDPDLCYRYALQLSRGGASRAKGVIRWADYALENKARWTGNTYKTRVFALYKLKAEAAAKLWQSTEAEFAEKHEEATEQEAVKYRGNAKEYAREWLDYAKASQQDTKTAMALCVSAAGSKDFCEGG